VSGASECSANDVVYSLNNGGASFISFDAATRVMTYDTTTKAGPFTITLTGSISNTPQGDQSA
jgi:hypothetical protein